jgi:plasmid stability protein
MAQLIVRKLEESVKRTLQRRAKRHGRSTEEEVREILRLVAEREPEETAIGFGSRLSANFADGGFEDGEIKEVRGRVRPAELK